MEAENQSVLIVGNSDGIGLALTRLLLDKGYQVTGFSRSGSPILDESNSHFIGDVTDPDYIGVISRIADETKPTICLYCPGIGELFDMNHPEAEIRTFEVNLMGMVKTASVLIPDMVRRGRGHFIGISSLADELISGEAPAYHATKSGFSNYLEGLAVALRDSGVAVSNVRFGFVDTKMAKGAAKPMMMSPEQAAEHLIRVIKKRPCRYTAPRQVIPLLKLHKFIAWLSRTVMRRE